MLLFRSLITGLLGACLYFVVRLPAALQEASSQPPAQEVVQSQMIAATVIDVAHGVPALTIPSLVQLSPGERIAAVDDRYVGNDLTAGAYIADSLDGTRRFVDLTIDGPTTTRRVLILMH